MLYSNGDRWRSKTGVIPNGCLSIRYHLNYFFVETGKGQERGVTCLSVSAGTNIQDDSCLSETRPNVINTDQRLS
jgi:hypothetical protein